MILMHYHGMKFKKATINNWKPVMNCQQFKISDARLQQTRFKLIKENTDWLANKMTRNIL
jgi:hypothetical protein